MRQADAIYARLVAEHGLYGQAFFGWRCHPGQRRMLNNLWRRAMRQARQTV